MKLRTRLIWIALALASSSLASSARNSEPPPGQIPAPLTQRELEPVLTAGTLSLQSAVALAHKSNPQIYSARAQFAKARSVVAQTNAAFLPHIAVSAQALQFDRKNEVDFGALMGGPSLRVPIAEEWNPSFGATLSWNIDLSGAVRSARSQAEFMAIAARLDLERVQNETTLAAQLAYFDVLKARGALKVAQASLESVAIRLRNAEQHERAGNAARFDVISARRDLADAELSVREALANEELALAALKSLIGVEQSVTIMVEPATLPTLDSEPIVETALKARPEVLQAEAVVRAMGYGVRVAGAGNKPTLSAGLGFAVQPNHGAFTKRELGSASLTLSIPLYDGGLARAKVREAEADRLGAEAQLRAAKNQITLQVQQILTQLKAASERVALSEAAVTEAREAYRLAQVRYGIGVTQSSVVSPQLELSTAQAALTRAEMTQSDARYDLQKAQAMLDFVLGRPFVSGAR